jgi:hypothetical protein
MTAAPTDDPKVVKMNRQKAKRGTSWKDNLSLNDKGTPKACLANAICNALQSSAARPAIIGRKLSTFGETIGGVKPELNMRHTPRAADGEDRQAPATAPFYACNGRRC